MGAVGEQEDGFGGGNGRSGEHGVMAGGVQTQDHFAPGRLFDPQPLRADGGPAIRADCQWGPDAPDIVPPRAARDRPHHGAVFLPGLIPGALRSLSEFAVDFVGIAVGAQRVDVEIGDGDLVDLFAGEVGREAALPVLMFAFDFAFGLRCGRVIQADVVELERPAQLGQRVGHIGKEEAVVIDIELQRPPVRQKRGGEEVVVGEQQFALVESGAGKQAAAIIQHVEHREADLRSRKPAVGRGIQLPEFADAGALPAPHRRQDALRWDRVGELMAERPAAHLRAVERKGVKAERLGSGETVGARRNTTEALGEEGQDGWWPGRGVIATRGAGDPAAVLFACVGPEVGGGQSVEATAGAAELVGGSRGCQRAEAKGFEDMPDEGGRMPMDELLILFMSSGYTCLPYPPTTSLFVSLATLGLLKDWSRGGQAFSPHRTREWELVLLC